MIHDTTATAKGLDGADLTREGGTERKKEGKGSKLTPRTEEEGKMTKGGNK